MASYSAHTNSQTTQNSCIVSGRLSHLSPSSSRTTDSGIIPKPLFVIRPSLNTGFTNTSTSVGNMSTNLLQLPVSSIDASQRTTIRLVPSASTCQPTIYPTAGVGNTFTIPGPFVPQTRFQSTSGNAQNIMFAGDNGPLVPGKPIRVIFPTQPTTVPSSVPLLYSSDISTSKSHTTKVVLRPVTQLTSISPSQLGRSVATASSFQQTFLPVTTTVSSSTYKRKPEKDTTMDLKIGSVFSHADASALWEDDKSVEIVVSKQNKSQEDVMEVNDDDAALVKTEDLRVEERSATDIKCNELTGDQMQINIARMAAQQMSELCIGKNKEETDEDVIHIIGNENIDDGDDTLSDPRDSDENFYPELVEKLLPNKRKPSFPTRACNVESALFSVLDELQRNKNRKRKKVTKMKEVEKKNAIKYTDTANESPKCTLNLTPTADMNDKELSCDMKNEDQSNATNKASVKSDPKSNTESETTLDSQPENNTTESKENEEETDDVVIIEPELNESTIDCENRAKILGSYPEIDLEEETDKDLVRSELHFKESINKKRKQFCPEKFVPNSVLQAKRMVSSSAISKQEQDSPSQLAKTSFRIQDPKPSSSPRNYATGRTQTPAVSTSDTDANKNQSQPTKQIRIITIPTEKSSGQVRVKNCVSIKPNASSSQNVTSQKPSTQGFLRIVKGGQVQLVPIQITHGAKGMILTPVSGELATDEMGLKPLPKMDKYRNIPKFGPGIEHLCIGVCSKTEIVEALVSTPLSEDDIADFEKVFGTNEKKVLQTDFVNLVKQQPVFQRPHKSMFDYRPWTKAEERVVRNFYKCRNCSVKLDKLTLSATQTVKLKKVLQAQLYCGFDYDSDSSSENEEILPSFGLDCEEVCVRTVTGILGKSILSDDVEDEISSIIAQVDRDHRKKKVVPKCTVASDNHDTAVPRLQAAQRFRTNGFINETVDPFDDHNYFNEDDDVIDDAFDGEDDVLDVAPEGVDCNEVDSDLESQEVQQCLNDLIDDDVPDYLNKTNEKEEERNIVQQSTETDIPEYSVGEFEKTTQNNVTEDADICKSIMLDCMDFEADTGPLTKAIDERSLFPVSEDDESDYLETVNSGSEGNSSISEEDTVVVDVEPAQLDQTCAVMKELAQKDFSSQEFSTSNFKYHGCPDVEIDELPTHRPSLDRDRIISPIVIAPISDEEYGADDGADEISLEMMEHPMATNGTNDQFHYIQDNVVGEVNIKTECENSNDIPLNNDFLRQNNAQSKTIETADLQYRSIQEGTAMDADIEGYGGTKSTKMPKKKKRRSSSETSEPKETFRIKLPDDYRHIPIMHCYSLLPDGVSYAKREKPSKKHSEGKTSTTGTRVPKVRRIQTGVRSAPESKGGKAVSLLNKQHQGVMLKIQDKPTFFFRVSTDNKLINFGDLKVSNEVPPQGTSLGKNSVPIAPSPGGVSLLKSQNPSSVVSPVSGTTVSIPSMASISADSVSKFTSLLKSRPVATASSSSGAHPGTPASSTKLAASTESVKCRSPDPKSQISSIKSPLRKNEVQKDKDQKLMSLLKPLQLQPGTKIKLKKVSAGGDKKDSPEKNKSSQKSFQVTFVNGQVTLLQKPNHDEEKVLTAEVSGQGDSKKVGGERDGDNVAKRKLETEDDNELDPKKVKFDPKVDRITKLKEQLRVQEEELEKIKKSREATKTLLSLYESDT